MEACPWAVVRRGTGGATEPARDGDRLQSASPGRSGRRAPGRASLALQPARSGGQCKRSGSRERRGGRQRDEQSQRDELPRVHSDLCIDEYFVRQKKRGAGRPGEAMAEEGTEPSSPAALRHRTSLAEQVRLQLTATMAEASEVVPRALLRLGVIGPVWWHF